MNKFILEFILVFCIAILPNIVYSIVYFKHPEKYKNSSNLSRLAWSFIHCLVSISLVFYIASNQSNGLRFVGIELTEVNFFFVILGGLFLYWIFVLTYYLSFRAIFNRKINTSGVYQEEILTYQTFLERVAFTVIIVLSVFSEELVYRGYLVLYLGEKTGTLFPWIALSILLSVVVHFYQGIEVSKIFYHFLFVFIQQALG